MSIGYKIKSVRKEKGITQEELANLANISRSHLSSVENGRNDISIKKLSDLAKVMNVSVGVFYV